MSLTNRLAKVIAALAAALVAGAAHGVVLTGAVAPTDGAETFHNPGCGPAESTASSFWAPLSPGMDTGGLDLCADAPNCSALWDLGAYSKGYLYCDANGEPLYGHYDYVTNHVGGADIPLDENALLAVSNSLLRCRLNGGTCIPRFAYTGKEKYGCEPDDFEMLLMHVRQLAAVISQFRDVVPAVECGMIGPWGEMHSSRYRAGENDEFPVRVAQAWLAGLPGDMALLVRYPRVWTHLLGTTTATLLAPGGLDAIDPALRQRMGFFNDGYLGSDTDYGTWRTGDYWMTRDQGRDFLRGQAVPYGGELASISDDFFDENVHFLDPTTTTNIVEEWYETHLSYLRNIAKPNNTINRRLAATTFNSKKWAFEGMPDLHEYEEQDLHKFCLDHMGYRFVVRDGRPTWRRNGATLNLLIENTGFGQLLFNEAHEVLLVPERGGSPVVVEAMLSRPLASLQGGSKAEVAVSFDWPPRLASGDYRVYLRVRLPLAGETAAAPPRRVVRFANRDGWDAGLQANYLCDIAIDAWADILPDHAWFAYGAASDTAIGGEWANLVPGANGLWARRDFAIDNPLSGGESGTVEIEMEVGAFTELPNDEPSAADFLFLLDEANERPVPYCHAAGGWTPLHGRDFREGERIVLKITLDSGHAAYEVDGLPLLDSSGHKFLPSSGRTLGTSTLLLLGGGIVSGFRGRHSRGLIVPTVFQGN